MLQALEYVGPHFWTASHPAVFVADDGRQYVAKQPGAGQSPHSPGDLAFEQVVLRLGAKLSAPVPPGATILSLDEEAISSGGTATKHLKPGPTSATLYLPNAGVLWLAQNAPECWWRSLAGARLSALLSWINTGPLERSPLQLLAIPGGEFIAVDFADLHSSCFTVLPEPRFPRAALTHFGTDDMIGEIDEIEGAMSNESIDLALAAVPDAWITPNERTSLATYLATRRDAMLAPLRNLSEGAASRR